MLRMELRIEKEQTCYWAYILSISKRNRNIGFQLIFLNTCRKSSPEGRDLIIAFSAYKLVGIQYILIFVNAMCTCYSLISFNSQIYSKKRKALTGCSFGIHAFLAGEGIWRKELY